MVLLQKLEHGIRDFAFSWLNCYLTDRKQFVHLNGMDFETKNITCGVPQGSVLYGITIWGNASRSLLEPIHIMQKKLFVWLLLMIDMLLCVVLLSIHTRYADDDLCIITVKDP